MAKQCAFTLLMWLKIHTSFCKGMEILRHFKDHIFWCVNITEDLSLGSNLTEVKSLLYRALYRRAKPCWQKEAIIMTTSSHSFKSFSRKTQNCLKILSNQIIHTQNFLCMCDNIQIPGTETFYLFSLISPIAVHGSTKDILSFPFVLCWASFFLSLRPGWNVISSKKLT